MADTVKKEFHVSSVLIKKVFPFFFSGYALQQMYMGTVLREQ